uniref:Uncharacterized protein n=1 Tax=Picea glauca TaxID=3330 RepID=A0A101LX58_PICGL|nr:hypothetical protein ABT39_MTgene5970 [Picea glauca]
MEGGPLSFHPAGLSYAKGRKVKVSQLYWGWKAFSFFPSPLWSSDYVPLPYGRATTFLSLMVERLRSSKSASPQTRYKSHANSSIRKHSEMRFLPYETLVCGGLGFDLILPLNRS